MAAITHIDDRNARLHVFYFGHCCLHGMRILKFAVFWGVYFVLVGVFEEFLMRGYTSHAQGRVIGFLAGGGAPFVCVWSGSLQQSWRRRGGAPGAVAIGFFFCLTLRGPGSLWFAVGFHAVWDWGQTYLLGYRTAGRWRRAICCGHRIRGRMVNRRERGSRGERPVLWYCW